MAYTHGESGYSNSGCRCDVCRAAHAVAGRDAREQRAARLAAGLVSPPHGRVTTYYNYKCRCDECKAAKAAAERELRARRSARSAPPL